MMGFAALNPSYKLDFARSRQVNWREHISIDPRIHHGKPCIKGTRVPVSVIIGTIAEGHTPERILKSWPQLTHEDIIAALKFAAKTAARADIAALTSDAE
jgi:uncharacterized protein (DUF433 family)